MSRISIALACALTVFPFAAGWAADLPAIADTNTDSSSPTTNFGSNGVLGVSGNRVALIRFNAASIAQSSGRTATLKLKVSLTKSSNNGVSIRLVNSAWDERTVTFRTLPQIASAPLDQKTISLADQGKVVSFDVSAALAVWKSNPAANFGLAIVAATPAPNVQLGSREGGSPAALAISGTVAADNDVTVSAVGGDYADPLTALQNAVKGDHWCVSPQPAKPCTVHIAAGLYPLRETLNLDDGIALVGEEKGETVLISSAPGFAMIASSPALLTDLTVVSSATTLLMHGQASLRLERVALRANATVLKVEGSTGNVLIDSDITSEADGDVIGIDFEPSGRSLTLTRSRVAAISKHGEAQAIEVSGSASGSAPITFQDSSLSAWGAVHAGGFRTEDEFAALLTVLRTNIDVSSPASAEGINGGDGRGVNIIDSHISVHGGSGGLGLAWDGNDIVLDNVTIDATSTAAAIGPPAYQAVDTLGTLSVLRSRLFSGGTALFSRQASTTVESSVLSAATAVSLQSGSKLGATSSQLVGTVTFNDDPDETVSTATCDHVLDGNLVLRNARCQSP